MLGSAFAMNCWTSGECSEAVSVLAGSVLTLFPGHPREHQVPQEHREEISLQEMGCCPEPLQKTCPFAAHPARGSYLPFVLFFTNLNRKSNAVGQKSSSNKTSRYAPDSLLLLTERLHLETCSFQKIAQVRPRADASLGCKPL